MVYDKVVYVDRDKGADGHDGESWAKPCKTINGALDKFYGGAQGTARGRHFAIIFQSRLTGGNAFTETQTIDVAGVHLIGAGLLYGDGGSFNSAFVTNSQLAAERAHHSGIWDSTRAGLIVDADDVLIAGLKFYCSDETNAMWHVVLHDRDVGNDSSQAGRNNMVTDCMFQGDVDGTQYINGIGVEGQETATIMNNRFMYHGTAIGLAGGGERYANKNIIENNKIFSCKYGIKLGNASTVENLIQDNTVIPKGTYGWAITYGIDASAGSGNAFIKNTVAHNTESTAYNYGSNNLWVENYHGTGGGTKANPDA